MEGQLGGKVAAGVAIATKTAAATEKKAVKKKKEEI